MYLQLAERRKGKVNVSSYKRSSKVSSHQRRYPLNENGQLDNPYIFIPNFESGGGIYVREDKFDGLPDNQWALFMKNLAPFQPEVQNQSLSEPMFLAGRAERKANRERRKDARLTKKEDKNDRKNQRVERRTENANRRADARDERIATRADRQANGGGFNWDKAKEVGGGLINRFTGGGQQDGAEYEEEPKKLLFGSALLSNPLFIGGVAIVIIGGVMYAMNKNKKQQPSMLPL